MARESVLRFRPDAKIVAHCANVKEATYDVNFFSQFAIVLNGLDNLDARRHVNRICIAANVPLVESGTTGYLGQVRPGAARRSPVLSRCAIKIPFPEARRPLPQVTTHLGGDMACYECTPKPVPKSFPVCTIRNTPDKVWWCTPLPSCKAPSPLPPEIPTSRSSTAAP